MITNCKRYRFFPSFHSSIIPSRFFSRPKVIFSHQCLKIWPKHSHLLGCPGHIPLMSLQCIEDKCLLDLLNRFSPCLLLELFQFFTRLRDVFLPPFFLLLTREDEVFCSNHLIFDHHHSPF